MDNMKKQTKKNQTHRYRIPTDGCQRVGGLQNGQNIKGIEKYSYKIVCVKYTIGNIVNNIY